MRQPLVVANWKMNGSLGSIRPLVHDIIHGLPKEYRSEIAICPPFTYLAELAAMLATVDIALGAQNLSAAEAGAHTGEIAVSMLKDFDCRFVIVGHSERRILYGESDETVAKKLVRAKAAGLIPILCVGEQLHEREAKATEAVIERQLLTVIDQAGIEVFDNAVIAYEPVWAIGTGKTASPLQAQEVHAFIRLLLARHHDHLADQIRVLYGGSVKAVNAKEIFNMADVDGGLIGGASLNADEFLSICHAA